MILLCILFFYQWWGGVIEMIVAWSIANCAYIILRGTSLMDIDGKRFFESISEMKDWLQPKGLTVRNKKVVKAEG